MQKPYDQTVAKRTRAKRENDLIIAYDASNAVIPIHVICCAEQS